MSQKGIGEGWRLATENCQEAILRKGNAEVAHAVAHDHARRIEWRTTDAVSENAPVGTFTKQ